MWGDTMADEVYCSDLFSGLKEFGLAEMENIPIYGEPDKVVRKQKKITEEDYLYDKEVECPVCRTKVLVRTVKLSKLSVVSRDTDSMITYKDINPLFYEIWICKQCGHAANQNQFCRDLLREQIEAIKKNISSKWRSKEYPPIYDADIAIERFKLALYNAIVRKAKNSEIAFLCLKMGWIYRTKGDQVNEIKYLSQALIGFNRVSTNERFPIVGMDEYTAMYMIGELSRRTGDNKEALLWFGRVLTSPLAKASLKDKARDQKFLIAKALAELQEEVPEKETVEPEKGAQTIASNKRGLGKLFLGGLSNLVIHR
jgi:hypothetical protein